MILTEKMIKEEELREIMLPNDKLVEIALNDFDEQLKMDEGNDSSSDTAINSY